MAAVDKQKLIRYLGSGIFIFLVMRLVDLAVIFETLKTINLWWYLIVFLITLSNKLISTYRWQLLLKVQKINEPFLKLYRLSLYALVFNLLLPSTIGGDSLRIYQLIKDNPNKKAASATATLMDRVSGLVALIFLVFITVWFVPNIIPQTKILLFIFCGFFLASSAFILWGRTPWVVSVLKKFMFGKWMSDKFDQIIGVLKTYKTNSQIILTTFILSLVFQTIQVFNQYFIFQSINVTISIMYLFLVIPVTNLIVALPISIGGVGLREISLIGLLAVVGIDEHIVVSYSLIGYSLRVLLSLGLLGYNFIEVPINERLHSNQSATTKSSK